MQQHILQFPQTQSGVHIKDLSCNGLINKSYYHEASLDTEQEPRCMVTKVLLISIILTQIQQFVMSKSTFCSTFHVALQGDYFINKIC